jgi:hypothetical protein
MGLKTTQTTSENIVWFTKIQDNIFFNNIKTTIYQIDPDQPGLIYQICNPDHETMIALYKAKQNKLWSSILNQPNVEEQNWKKFIKK